MHVLSSRRCGRPSACPNSWQVACIRSCADADRALRFKRTKPQEGESLTELAAVPPAHPTEVGFGDTDAGLTGRTPPVPEPHSPQPGVPHRYRPLHRPRRARLALHVDDGHTRSTDAALRRRRRTASLRRGQRQHQRDRCGRDGPAPPHAAVLPPRAWFITTNCDPPAASGLPRRQSCVAGAARRRLWQPGCGV